MAFSARGSPLGHLAVLAAPFGNGIERVEQEVRVEMGAEREQLRPLGLASQGIGPGALPGEAALESDVAP